jgi:hypothetical protein
MNPQHALIIVHALNAAGFYGPPTGAGKPPNRRRPCLVCRKPHENNNSFCSAACCAEFKQAKAMKGNGR